MIAEETLSKMVEIIVRAIDPVEIILFGSQARNDAREDSDVDILIVEDHQYQPGESRRQRLADLYRVLMPFRFAKDLLLFNRSEFERRSKTLNHVTAYAVREGKVLYERN